MSVNSSDNQEIDLGQVSKKIGQTYQNFLSWVFRGILFVKRNFILLLILFIVGAALGFYLDKKVASYNHQIIISPNFGSTDYVYAKIDLLQSKINENDTTFLKEIGIKDTKKFGKISVMPIIDVYKFISNKAENFELIKLLAEDGNIDKIVENKLTSKNYPFHVVSFSTSKISSEEKTVNPILNYLNDSQYYKALQKEYLNNIQLKMKANDSIINQIDALMNQFKKTASGSSQSDKLVYYNENTQLNEVIKTKDNLVREQGLLRIDLISLDKVVKDNSVILNSKDTKGTNGKMKFLIPFLFLILFMTVKGFIRFYNNQLAKN
ncbi:MAG TPA: hypothetical protein PLC36_10150 [Flavobacterium sp.]|nr:hypothetical protein [Flavobacterium sp.]